MGTTGFIIFAVIAVVWQIVSSKMQQSAKRQEEQRRREATARRLQPAAGQPGTPPVVQAGGFAPPTQSAQPQTRGPLGATARDELAARRQAQLEELRRRRQAQQGGSTAKAASTRATRQPIRDIGAPQATPQPVPRRQPVSAPPGPADLFRAEQARQLRERRQRQEEEARQRAAAERQKLAEQAAAQKAASAIARDQIREKFEHRRSKSESLRRGTPPIGDPTTPSTKRVRAMLSHRGSLRDLFLLKELLEPPVTEREKGAGYVPVDGR